jgi:hypothetical protein
MPAERGFDMRNATLPSAIARMETEQRDFPRAGAPCAAHIGGE